MQSCPSSVVRLSVCLSVVNFEGGGVNLRNASATSLLVFFGMELLWDDINHISKDRFDWRPFAPKLFDNFGMKLPKEGSNGLPKYGFIESL